MPLPTPDAIKKKYGLPNDVIVDAPNGQPTENFIPLGAMAMQYTLGANDVPEPSNTQGIGSLERFMVKNFSANPDRMQAWLQQMGYETRPYKGKGGFNFSVRKNKEEPWSVVDPAGFDIQDIFDIVSDVAQGFVTGSVGAAGAVGGAFVGAAIGNVPGGIAGAVGAGGAAAGFAGGGTEFLRQEAGKMLGAPDNIDTDMIKHEAFVSGIMQAALPGVGAATRGAGRVARFVAREYGAPIGATVARFRSTVGLPGGEVLMSRAANKAKTLRDKAHAAVVLTNLVSNTASHRFPETALAQNLASATGAVVDARVVQGELLDLTMQSIGEQAKTTTKRIITEAEFNASRMAARANVGMRNAESLNLLTGDLSQSARIGMAEGLGETATRGVSFADRTVTKTSMDEAFEAATDQLSAQLISEPSLAKSVGGLLEHIDTYTTRTAGHTDWSQLPIDTLTIIHDQLRRIARQGKAFTGAPINDSFIRTVAKAKHDIGILIQNAMKKPSAEQMQEAAKAGMPVEQLSSLVNPLYYPWRQARVKVMGKASSLDDFRHAIFGTGGLTRAEVNGRAEAIVDSWGGNNPSGTRRMIHQWIKRFGAESFEPSKRAIYEANIAEAVGAGGGGVGRLTKRPTFTTVGTVMLGSTISSVLGVGPLIGAAGGLAIGNPAGVVGLARLAQRAGRVMDRVPGSTTGNALSTTSRTAGFGIAQEEPRTRRRANLTSSY